MAIPIRASEATRGAWESFYAEGNRSRVPRYPIDHVVRFVFRRLAPTRYRRRPLRILDLGCGGGRHLRMLAQEGFETVGVDLSLRSLRHLRRKSEGRMKLASSSFVHLPFVADSFDAVVCYGVLYYGRPEETAAGIREIHRVLKRGGWAFFTLRGTDDSRYGRGRELAPHCFLLDSDDTHEKGMTVTFHDAAAVDGLTAGFQRRFIGYAKVGSAPGRTDSDWLVEVQK